MWNSVLPCLSLLLGASLALPVPPVPHSAKLSISPSAITHRLMDQSVKNVLLTGPIEECAELFPIEDDSSASESPKEPQELSVEDFGVKATKGSESSNTDEQLSKDETESISDVEDYIDDGLLEDADKTDRLMKLSSSHEFDEPSFHDQTHQTTDIGSGSKSKLDFELSSKTSQQSEQLSEFPPRFREELAVSSVRENSERDFELAQEMLCPPNIDCLSEARERRNLEAKQRFPSPMRNSYQEFPSDNQRQVTIPRKRRSAAADPEAEESHDVTPKTVVQNKFAFLHGNRFSHFNPFSRYYKRYRPSNTYSLYDHRDYQGYRNRYDRPYRRYPANHFKPYRSQYGY